MLPTCRVPSSAGHAIKPKRIIGLSRRSSPRKIPRRTKHIGVLRATRHDPNGGQHSLPIGGERVNGSLDALGLVAVIAALDCLVLLVIGASACGVANCPAIIRTVAEKSNIRQSCPGRPKVSGVWSRNGRDCPGRS